MFNKERVAAQLNSLCKGLPLPDAENSATGRETPLAKTKTKTNIKEETSSSNETYIKKEKTDATQDKHLCCQRQKRECPPCSWIALKSASSCAAIGTTKLNIQYLDYLVDKPITDVVGIAIDT